MMETTLKMGKGIIKVDDPRYCPVCQAIHGAVDENGAQRYFVAYLGTAPGCIDECSDAFPSESCGCDEVAK